VRRSREAEEETRSLTPNQVVAYNLPRARMIRGWTQEQAAEALAPYLGTRWSVANFSAIERSVDGGRIRQFTADDLVALSRGFDLPIGFFLTPPASGAEGMRITTPDTKGRGADPMVMMDALLGTDDNFHYLEDVVGTWGAFAGRRAVIDDKGRWTDKGPIVADQLPRARRLARLRGKMVLRQEFGELEAARHALRQLADVLDDIEAEDEGTSPGEQEG
jgi:transcriptional regulator with XRE-family HTH domain